MLTSNTSSEKYTQVRGLTQLDNLLTDRPTNTQMAKGAKINLGFKKKSFGMLLLKNTAVFFFTKLVKSKGVYSLMIIKADISITFIQIIPLSCNLCI